MIKIQFIQIVLYVYFTIVIICVILFYYYFLNLHMNYDNYECDRNHNFNNNDRIDLNNILLNENISKRQQESYYMNFKNRALFNYEILKDNIYYIFNYCITNVKTIIKRYKYNKLNTDDDDDENNVEDNVIDDYLYNNDVYINGDEINSDEYYHSKYNKPYFNYELNNVNINSVNHSNNVKSIPELVQKSNMKNSLNLDLTSTINTDEIYNNSYNESSTFNFSITRVDSDCDSDNDSSDSCLNNSLIK